MSEQVVIAPETLQKLVKQILENEKFTNYVINYTSLSTGGANYSGLLYIVDVKDGERELSLFSKVLNMSEKMRRNLEVKEMFAREMFVYTELASEFVDLEVKHGLPNDQRFEIIKYYGSDETKFQETLVLENLGVKGYELYDRLKSINWQYAKAAITEMAKFHALSYALREDNPKKFDEMIKSKHYIFEKLFKIQPGPHADGLLTIATEACDSEHVAAFTTFFEGLNEYYNKQLTSDEYSVLVHSDYRPSNILVKYEEGELKSLIPIDYQTIFYGSPINDLLYLIFLGSDQEFRNNHYDACIQLYYESLSASLARFSLDIDQIYPRALFNSHLKEKLLFGLAVAVLLLPVILVDSADAPKVEEIFSTRPKVSELYNERFRGIVQDMVKWGALVL